MEDELVFKISELKIKKARLEKVIEDSQIELNAINYLLKGSGSKSKTTATNSSSHEILQLLSQHPNEILSIQNIYDLYSENNLGEIKLTSLPSILARLTNNYPNIVERVEPGKFQYVEGVKAAEDDELPF